MIKLSTKLFAAFVADTVLVRCYLGYEPAIAVRAMGAKRA